MNTNTSSIPYRVVLAAAMVSAAMFGVHVASAQETKPTAEEKNESQEIANQRYLADMRTLAETIEVTVGEGEDRKEAKLIPNPVFRFSDPSRTYSDGSVWAWVTDGRPVMMIEVKTAERNKGVWGHDLVATSDVRFSAEVAGHGRWAPHEVEFKQLSAKGISAPAKTEAARLRQMKRFASSLDASEEWQGQRTELRLLPTEIYRYSNAESGLVDGAVFLFAVGSNPEAILLVEAHKAESGELAWKYGLARMSAAAVTFRLGDTEVWTVPLSYGSRSSGYYLLSRRASDLRRPVDNSAKKTSE